MCYQRITGMVPGKAASITDTSVLTGSLNDMDDSFQICKFLLMYVECMFAYNFKYIFNNNAKLVFVHLISHVQYPPTKGW